MKGVHMLSKNVDLKRRLYLALVAAGIHTST